MRRRGAWHIEGGILMQAALPATLSILQGELGGEKIPHLSSKLPLAFHWWQFCHVSIALVRRWKLNC